MVVEGDLDPVEPFFGLPVELGVRPRVDVVEVVGDFEIEEVDERDEADFFAVAVAADHQDEDDEAERAHQTNLRESCVSLPLPEEPTPRLLTTIKTTSNSSSAQSQP